MRIASFALVGIAVTTAFFLVRHLSERGDTDEKDRNTSDRKSGTDDPTRSPTPEKNRIFFPGEVLTISLSQRPALHYGAGAAIDAYSELAIEAARDRARYDVALSRAAAETAVQAAIHRGAAPEEIAAFILHSAGAPDSTAARFSLRTNDTDDNVVARAIDEALASPPKGTGGLYFGVGEADTPGDAHARHIIVLMTRRAYILAPAARQVALGGTWEARGELAEGFSQASAKVLYPDGRLEEAQLELDGRRFVARTPAGDEPGTLRIGIDAVGPTGPTKLVQVPVEVGGKIPTQLSVRIAEREPEFASIAEAEAHALVLLARDREQAGAPPLAYDDDLADVARGHSEEMATVQFFAHQSPTTGLVGDRIRAAQYRASSFAENLAKNDSLAEAESSLLLSVGHRANLLSSGFSHVGIGIARAVERGRAQWYVTQLFARKAIELDTAAVTGGLYDQAAAARDKARLGQLETDSRLTTVAAEGADRASRGDTDNIAKQLGQRARDATNRSVRVSVQVIYDIDQFQLPETVLKTDADAIGIGVSQSQTDEAGRIAVVVITSE